MKSFSFFLFIFILSFHTHGSSKSFQLRFASNDSISEKASENIKLELDYKMIKSKAFCPAHSFARRSGRWTCNEKNECRAAIRCQLITKKESREQVLKGLGNTSKVETPYKIYVTKRPLVTLKSQKIKKVAITKERKLSKKAPLTFEEGSGQIELFNEDALLEEGEGLSNTVAIDPKNDLEDDLEKSEESNELALFDKKEIKEDKEIDKMSDREESPSTRRHGFKPLHFSVQLVNASLETFSSKESLGPNVGLRWHPHYYFSDKFSVGAEFSWNAFSLTTAGTDVSLSVLGYGLFAKYLFGQHVYGIIGYGQESWSASEVGTELDSFSRLSYGAGYQFSKKIFGFIDSIEIVGASLSGSSESLNASHFKLSFNMSFY